MLDEELAVVKVKVPQWCLTLCRQSMKFSRPEYWSDSHSLLQGIFPTQGLNPGLPHCRQILYQLSHKGSPRILEWVAYPFSSRSSWPRNSTGVSCIAGRFFITWALKPSLLHTATLLSFSKKKFKRTQQRPSLTQCPLKPLSCLSTFSFMEKKKICSDICSFLLFLNPHLTFSFKYIRINLLPQY